jgi:hypothetical protein
VGEFAGWSPIGAAPTAGGYQVAWQSGNQFGIWNTDSNGNYLSGSSVLSGQGSALESYETGFYQDLNGDGYLGSPASVIDVSGNAVIALNPLKQAVTIEAGATLELAGPDTASVTFAGSTGTLVIDHSATFSGNIAGQLAIGDVIDLADISAGATISYSGNSSPGTLTVSDGTHTAHLALLGNYSPANFTASSDSHGGTSVVDPPISSPAAGAAAASTSTADTPVTQMPVVAENRYAIFGPAAAAIEVQPAGFASGQAMPAPAALLFPVSSESTGTSGASTTPDSSAVILGQLAAASGARPLETGKTGPLAQAESPRSAIAREIVSPDDLILAIRTGHIMIKTEAGDGLERAPWLFDADQGTFEAPLPEPFTVRLADDDAADEPAAVAPGEMPDHQGVIVPRSPGSPHSRGSGPSPAAACGGDVERAPRFHAGG